MRDGCAGAAARRGAEASKTPEARAGPLPILAPRAPLGLTAYPIGPPALLSAKPVMSE